jgi:hypothetical protein
MEHAGRGLERSGLGHDQVDAGADRPPGGGRPGKVSAGGHGGGHQDPPDVVWPEPCPDETPDPKLPNDPELLEDPELLDDPELVDPELDDPELVDPELMDPEPVPDEPLELLPAEDEAPVPVLLAA